MTAPATPSYSEMTLDELRPHLVAAMLPHVPFDGWSETAAEAGARDLGLPEGRGCITFPGGATEMIEAYIARADARMRDALDQRGTHALKIRDRIALAVRTRFDQAADEREALRRAAAILALPQNAALSARMLWRTADAIWHAAGDTATDYNHYSKRLILGGVYAATLLVWLQDESEGFAETYAFLDRRIAGILRFERTKAQILKSSGNLPSLARFLGRLRYPPA